MKSDWITIIAIFLMLGSLLIGVSFYYNSQIQECTSNPLSYGAKTMQERYGYEFIGTGFFITPFDKKAPIIVFNSESVEINMN